MKQDIHPDYHKITVVMTDGTKYETRSTWGKEGEVLQLDVDPKSHPAWVGGINLRKTGQMEKFQNKFGDFALASKGAKKEAAPAQPKKKEKEAAAVEKKNAAPEKKEAASPEKKEEEK